MYIVIFSRYIIALVTIRLYALISLARILLSLAAFQLTIYIITLVTSSSKNQLSYGSNIALREGNIRSSTSLAIGGISRKKLSARILALSLLIMAGCSSLLALGQVSGSILVLAGFFLYLSQAYFSRAYRPYQSYQTLLTAQRQALILALLITQLQCATTLAEAYQLYSILWLFQYLLA